MSLNLWKLRYFPASVVNKITFSRRKITVGRGSRIYGRVLVKGSGKITIGSDCTINSSVHADPIGGDAQVILRADAGAELIIGNQCGLSNCAIVAKEKIVLEDRVYIGGGCKIYDTDFHALDMQARVNEESEGIVNKPIVIREGAFIGAHAIILKGVEIGKNSIIGAGSVVTKSVPDNEIWGGNPAKKLKDL